MKVVVNSFVGYLANRDIQTSSNILNSLGVLTNDTNTTGNSLSSNGVITSDHDNLDTGRSALLDGVWHSGTRRVNHTHEAKETQVAEWEVSLIGVELVASRVSFRVQSKVAETEHTLAQASEFHVGRVELVLPEVGELQVRAVHVDRSGALEDSFWRALHHQQVALISVIGFVH